jgi:gliding motility-associated-like protein
VLQPRCLPDSSMVYYLKVSSGVAPTECSTYDSVMVSIVPGVTAEIIPPDTNIICQGQPLYLEASGGIGSASYQWWPAAGLSNTQSGSVYATPQADTRYFVAVSEGGCTDTAFVDLFVHPTPEASFSISQAYGCAPLEIYTQNLSSHALAFEWKVSPGNFYSNEREPKISFPSTGVYSITLIARAPGACADTLTHPLPITIIDNILPIVYSEPQFPVRLSLPHAPVSFVDSTEDAVEWMWDFGDGYNSRERKTSHAWQKPGTYFVTLQVNNLYGCPGLLTLGPYILEEPSLFIPNVFSPNGDGIHDRFNIEYSGDETFVLKIVDRWGVSLFETYNKEQGWDGRNLQGQELDAGVYFYHCQIGKKAYSGSVTMMR